jgi:DNA mismatch repair protein PMS2
VTTARAEDAPKGTRLDFETSGKLKSKTVVASQKGTTVTVEQIFKNLPVRRKELERNIRREYQKVLNLLNAYACISIGVRFVVSNLDVKGYVGMQRSVSTNVCRKRNVVFSTNASSSTKDNIASVFSAKMLQSLLPLDLKFELNPSALPNHTTRNWTAQENEFSQEVRIVGHISRPVVGEGRQAADRQLFFVNSRPCGLPQVAKAFNEVYRSYNVTQSPFIFADLRLDTNAYDVNVSPDKRTILLHDQTVLLETLKEKLMELFDGHEQSVPDSNMSIRKLPSYKLPTIIRPPPVAFNTDSNARQGSPNLPSSQDDEEAQSSLLRKFVSRGTVDRIHAQPSVLAQKVATRRTIRSPTVSKEPLTEEHDQDDEDQPMDANVSTLPPAVKDFNRALRANIQRPSSQISDSSEINTSLPSVDDRISKREATRNANQREEPIPSSTPNSKPKSSFAFQSSLDRMRRHRPEEDTATVTIGNATTVTTIGSPLAKRRKTESSKLVSKQSSRSDPVLIKSLRSFAAPGTQYDADMDETDLPLDHQAADDESSESDASEPTDGDGIEVSQGKLEEGPRSDGSESSDAEYIDESEKKAREEATVAKLIAAAEHTRARPTEENEKRAKSVLQAHGRKDSTLQLLQKVTLDMDSLDVTAQALRNGLRMARNQRATFGKSDNAPKIDAEQEEERLALTVSKSDFVRMHVVGQFNLGFILALRPASLDQTSLPDTGRQTDELFIIDQHASDEKFNFERLQLETTVQNQPLVHPKILELTAVEEELLANNPVALAKNGFQVLIDTSGEKPVGKRCKLVSLPMSKEVVFDHRDLEELLALLLDESGTMLATSTTAHTHTNQHGDSTTVLVPRPSKVRRMFAMRACRASIMVGKHLTKNQMGKVIRHMGEIDKPWNCPHGRPTMRHLYGLGSWKGWSEGDGLVGMEDEDDTPKGVDWAAFAEGWPESEDHGEYEEEESLDEDEDGFEDDDEAMEDEDD